jgi:hypothetical protein
MGPTSWQTCKTWYTVEVKRWEAGSSAGDDESQYLNKCTTTYSQYKISHLPGATWSGVPLPVGTAITTGELQLRNHGTTTAVVDGLVLVHRDEGIKVLGTYAVRLGDAHPPSDYLGEHKGFPPAHAGAAALQPVRGAQVKPFHDLNDSVAILIGLKPTRAGTFKYDAVEVTYHVGRTHYTTHYDFPVRICAPVDQKCPAP